MTALRLNRAGGNAPNACFKNVGLAVDIDADGIYTPFVDQISGARVPTVDFDQPTGQVIGAANAPFSNTPLRQTAVPETWFIVADIDPTCTGGTLILGVRPIVEDIPPGTITDTFPTIAFPLTSPLQFSIGGSLTGQGESIARDITVQAVPTMVGTQTAGPGQSKIIAVYGICDGGLSMVWVPISVAFATGYVGCIATGTEDGFPTAVSLAKVKRVSGNLNKVKLQLWLDRNGSQAPDPGEEIGPVGGLLCDFSTTGECVFGTPGNLLIDSGPGDSAGTIFPSLGGLLDPAVGTCPAGNSIFAGAAYCGATLFLTAEPLENGTLQVQTTFVASDIPRLGLTPTSGFKEQPGVSPVILNATGFGPGGPTTATLVASVGKPPKKPSKSMTYKDVFVSATGPAGASKMLTGFSVPGCTVKSVKGPALPQNVTVGGAPVGPFKVKVKCATKPGSVPGLTPLRVGGESDTGVPGLIPLKAGSVGTVEIYTLTGKKVLETGFSGGALDATKLDLPNGVYLYVVKTVTPEGIIKSELKKLVVKN